jgi:oligopeptide transport system ATP-binding protein
MSFDTAPAPSSNKPVLSVRNLALEFATYGGSVQAVRDVSFDVFPGEVLAIVGESGCGKSVTVQTLMGLIPCPPGKITSGKAFLGDRDLLKMSRTEMQGVCGKEMSMIFQDPLTSLNPTMTIGKQIGEVLIKHRGMTASQARQETIDIMKLVQIPEAARRLNQYPHEFSGGMRQRVMIAIALACRPKVLIADEPTTALDVTIQQQILELLRKLRKEINMAVVLITHDLGVVASLADRVAVMYAGQIVETGTVDEVFISPKHPYTVGLQKAIPDPLSPNKTDLVAIPGSPPDLFSPPAGCAFAERCKYALQICEAQPPALNALGTTTARPRDIQRAACWLHHPHAPAAMREDLLSNGLS